MLPDRAAAMMLADVDAHWLDGVTWLHVPSYSLLSEPIGSSVLAMIKAARPRGVKVSVDVSSVAVVEQFGVAALRLAARRAGPRRRLRQRTRVAPAAEDCAVPGDRQGRPASRSGSRSSEAVRGRRTGAPTSPTRPGPATPSPPATSRRRSAARALQQRCRRHRARRPSAPSLGAVPGVAGCVTTYTSVVCGEPETEVRPSAPLSWHRHGGQPSPWRRGRVVQARACKALYPGSIPGVASSLRPAILPGQRLFSRQPRVTVSDLR